MLVTKLCQVHSGYTLHIYASQHMLSPTTLWATQIFLCHHADFLFMFPCLPLMVLNLLSSTCLNPWNFGSSIKPNVSTHTWDKGFIHVGAYIYMASPIRNVRIYLLVLINLTTKRKKEKMAQPARTLGYSCVDAPCAPTIKYLCCDWVNMELTTRSATFVECFL